MIDFLRPIIGRIAGSVVGALAAWLVGKYGYTIDSGLQSQITDGLVAFMMLVFGVVYALVHKAVSAKVNPGDAATPKLAEQSKLAQNRPGRI